MGANSIEIIALEAKDIGALASLAKEIWTQHYTPIIGEAQVAYMIEKFQSEKAIEQQLGESIHYDVVWQNNKLIGYMSYFAKNDSLFLSKYYLQKSHRGKGIGSKMLKHLIKVAKSQGALFIELTVNKFNSTTINQYQKMGFELKGPVVFDIGNGFIMDDYEMALALEDEAPNELA